VLFNDLLVVFAAHDLANPLLQTSLDFGIVAIADGFEQQISQGSLIEDAAKDVEHLAAECLPLHLQLVEEFLEDGSFTRLAGNQVPAVAHFLLPDSMNTAKPLL
jgi:hypothetical protein